MTPEIAQNILNFLSRVDLKGNEAPAMMQCIDAVQQSVKQPEASPDGDEG